MAVAAVVGEAVAVAAVVGEAVAEVQRVGGAAADADGRGRGRGGRDRFPVGDVGGMEEEEGQQLTFDDDADFDEELGITSSEHAPVGWSHPLCVNTLEPTLATPENELPENIKRRPSRSQQRKGEEVLVKQRQVPSRGEHRENMLLMKKAKRPITLFPMKNGEMYAILEEDDAELREIAGMPPKKAKRRGRPPKKYRNDDDDGGGGGDAGEAPAAPVESAPKDSWVSCDRCEKWRRITSAAYAVVESNLSNEWYCEMNVDDPLHASCDAEEEEEEEKKEEGAA